MISVPIATAMGKARVFFRIHYRQDSILMPHITKRQHYVPKFYLQLWSNENGQLVGHDLVSKGAFASSPDGLLNKRYFYEENRASPDNRVENILAQVESAAAPVFEKMNATLSRHSTIPSTAAAELRRGLTNQDADNLACFSALQYLRVPDAIAQKRRELLASDITENELDRALNPGRFTLSGYDYVRDRFRQMKLMLMISPERQFITSDRPCFDMKDSDNAPLLGEEIGRDPLVVCYLPLTPRIGAVFYPLHFSAGSPAAPKFIVQTVADRIVKNRILSLSSKPLNTSLRCRKKGTSLRLRQNAREDEHTIELG